MADNRKNAAPEENAAEEAEEMNVITLEDEDGREVNFEIVVELEHEGVRYRAGVELVEDESVDADSTLILLRVDEDAEGEYMTVVTDDNELQTVGEKVEKLLSEGYTVEL